MKTGLRNNNKGYSLVELIIVMAILVIVGGAVISNMSLLTNGKNKRCIQSIHTAIGKTKVNAMAKENAALYLWQDDDGVKIKQVVWSGATNEADAVAATAEEIIGPANLEVYYNTSSSATAGDPLKGAGYKIIKFDRTDGSIDETGTSFCYVECGKYKVKVYEDTGKVEMEK